VKALESLLTERELGDPAALLHEEPIPAGDPILEAGQLQLRDDAYDPDGRVAAALARSPITAARPVGPARSTSPPHTGTGSRQ
jgi:hypothetical protein